MRGVLHARMREENPETGDFLSRLIEVHKAEPETITEEVLVVSVYDVLSVAVQLDSRTAQSSNRRMLRCCIRGFVSLVGSRGGDTG